MTILEQIEIMQAYADGREIEFIDRYNIWRSAPKPSWNWKDCLYRIKPSFEWSFPPTTYRADNYGTAECNIIADIVDLGIIRSTRKQAEDSHARMVQSNVLEQLVYQFQNEVTYKDTCYIYLDADNTYKLSNAVTQHIGGIQMNHITAQKICNLLNSGEVTL